MANKITHVNWHAVEEKYGKLLRKHQVCILLGISESEFDEYYQSNLITTSFDTSAGFVGFHIAEVKYFAETHLGIKDGSYEAGKEEAKNQATTQPPIEDFFTSTCSTITQRIADAQAIAEKNGSECALSYLIGSFEIASSSIKKYIQTQQKGGK
jgi:hypothetical protein